MRHLTVLVLSIVILSSCDNRPTEVNDLSDNVNNTLKNDIKGFTAFSKLIFEGDLKAKKPIPIVLEVMKTGNDLVGQMLYKKVGEPIPLTGTIDEAGTINLHENLNGSITGHYEGQIHDNVFNGLWTSGNKKSSFEYSLNISRKDFSSFIKAKDNYTGLYEVKPDNAEDDFYFKFEVEKLNEKEIKVLFFGNIGKPSYNHGAVEGIAALNDDIATFRDGNCAFQLKFIEEGLNVTYLEDADPSDCDMGARVYVSGEYKKTNSDKPAFENPMDM